MAADATVYKLGKVSGNNLRFDEQAFRKCFTINMLAVKTDKSNPINFRKARAIDQAAFHENNVANASCKNLGISLNNKLKFKDHVKYVTKKLIKSCSLKHKISDWYPRKYPFLFFISYAKTTVTYVLLAYGATTKTTLQPKEKLEQKYLRAIFHKRNVDLLQEVLRKDHLQTIYELFCIQLIS